MNDPYKVLGIEPSATDDEVKKAYRDLARKYHPDNYVNNPLADLVEEKMKEINEAYDTIQKQRAAGNTGTGYSSRTSSSYQNTSSGGNYNNIRRAINESRYSEAEMMLDSIMEHDRGAEWNYLKGCVLLRRGFVFDAQRYIDTACYMDPQNSEYRAARDQLHSRAGSFGSGYNTSRGAGGCDVCDLCSSLVCLDCMCECCGGDLIRCC